MSEEGKRRSANPIGGVRAFFMRHRRKFATIALIFFLGGVFREFAVVMPQTVEVAFDLGPAHQAYVDGLVRYELDGEIVREVSHHWPQGAPAELHDEAELSPGRYAIAVALTDRGGTVHQLGGSLRTPTQGAVRVRLR